MNTVSNVEARGYECPLCYARPGERCVRVVRTTYGQDPERVARWAVNANAGRPIPSVHHERRRLARHQRRTASLTRRTDRQLAVAAYREFERDEVAALQYWLLRHGRILWADARADEEVA